MKIFIPGATGYIGGTVAAHLLAEGHDILGLARTEQKATALRAIGIEPLLGDLEQAEILARGARTTDATISVADSDRLDLATTLVEAMAGSGKTLIHTSGSSIVVDDAKGAFAGTNVYSDDAHYEPMEHRLARIAVDQFVRTAGITRGIRAMVVCPTMVYGPGRGIKADSDQIPKVVAKSRTVGAGVYVGDGLNIWSNVHVDDLASLYSLVLEKAPSGSFLFAENGESDMRGVAAAVSASLGLGGRTRSWPLDKAVAELGLWPQVALATNCRVRAVNARALGWRPNGPSLAQAIGG